MAKVQTTIRLINVKETYEQVYKAMDFQWLDLNENIIFHGEMSGKTHKQERPIRINRDYIVEIYRK